MTKLTESRVDAILAVLKPEGGWTEDLLDDDYPGWDPDNRFVHALLRWEYTDDSVDYDQAAERVRGLLRLLESHGRLSGPRT